MPARARRIVASEMEWPTSDLPEFDAHPHPIGNIAGPITRNHLPPGLVAKNTMLSNGARLYLDHSNLEYSTGEVREPMPHEEPAKENEHNWLDEIVAAELAGERIAFFVLAAAKRAGAIRDFKLHNRVIDENGITWGYHQNYLCDRKKMPLLTTEEAFGRDVAHPDIHLLLTWLALRNLFVGAGGISGGRYIIGQKSSKLSKEVNSATTYDKPLLNTRDEPLADARRFRRLHYTAGDSNVSLFAKRLSFSGTALFARMTEEGEQVDPQLRLPVGKAHELAVQVSTDTTFKKSFTLANGKTILPYELAGNITEQAEQFIGRRKDTSPEDRWAVAALKKVLKGIEDDPWQLEMLDWAMRRALIAAYLGKRGLDMTSSDGLRWAQSIDLQYDHTYFADQANTKGEDEEEEEEEKKESIGAKLRRTKWREWTPPEELVEKHMTEGPAGRAAWRGKMVKDDQTDRVTWGDVRNESADGVRKRTLKCRDPLVPLDSPEFAQTW